MKGHLAVISVHVRYSSATPDSLGKVGHFATQTSNGMLARALGEWWHRISWRLPWCQDSDRGSPLSRLLSGWMRGSASVWYPDSSVPSLGPGEGKARCVATASVPLFTAPPCPHTFSSGQDLWPLKEIQIKSEYIFHRTIELIPISSSIAPAHPQRGTSMLV